MAPDPDPVTGRPVTLPPTEVPNVPMYLAQRATTNVGSAVEIEGQQTTTVALADCLVKRGYAVSEKSEVIDDTGVLGTPGAVWRVEGRPADRGIYVSAALRWISDMQEA